MIHAVPNLATSSHDTTTHTHAPRLNTVGGPLTLSYADYLLVEALSQPLPPSPPPAMTFLHEIQPLVQATTPMEAIKVITS